MREAGIYRIALVQTVLRVACGDGRVRILLYVIYPRAELIERNMQTRFLVVLEGCIGGLDKILSRFFTLHVFENGFLHDVVRGALLHGSQRSNSITVRRVEFDRDRSGRT